MDEVNNTMIPRGEVIDKVSALVHRYVEHDMEWAALAIEETGRGLDGELDVCESRSAMSALVRVRLEKLAASVRERGR